MKSAAETNTTKQPSALACSQHSQLPHLGSIMMQSLCTTYATKLEVIAKLFSYCRLHCQLLQGQQNTCDWETNGRQCWNLQVLFLQNCWHWPEGTMKDKGTARDKFPVWAWACQETVQQSAKYRGRCFSSCLFQQNDAVSSTASYKNGMDESRMKGNMQQWQELTWTTNPLDTKVTVWEMDMAVLQGDYQVEKWKGGYW